MEEAMAYQTLIDEYGLRQEDIADRVSKNRTTITNALRLLKLSEEVREMVAQGILSAGHARTLVVVEDPEEQLALAKEIAEKGLSVRDTERLIKLRGRKKAKPEDPEKTADDPLKIFYRDYEEQMHTLLGTKVRINRRDKNKGRIEIDYYSQDELERLMDLFRSVGHE
jgi:ParB family chromosome partitioning protein